MDKPTSRPQAILRTVGAAALTGILSAPVWWDDLANLVRNTALQAHEVQKPQKVKHELHVVSPKAPEGVELPVGEDIKQPVTIDQWESVWGAEPCHTKAFYDAPWYMDLVDYAIFVGGNQNYTEEQSAGACPKFNEEGTVRVSVVELGFEAMLEPEDTIESFSAWYYPDMQRLELWEGKRRGPTKRPFKTFRLGS